MEPFFDKFKIPIREGRGFSLSPIELKDYISFEPKRVYYLTDLITSTGQHCHLKEEEFFVMLKGKCNAVIDKGSGREDVPLDTNDAIYVPSYVWHGFKDFSGDAIILALSSTNYDPDRSDYLEDYERYLEIRDEKFRELYGI